MEPEEANALHRLELEYVQLQTDVMSNRRLMKKGKSRLEKLSSQLHLTQQQIDFFTQESVRIMQSIRETSEKLTREQCQDLCKVANPTSMLLELADKFMLLLGFKDRSWTGFRTAAQHCDSLKQAMDRLSTDELKEEQLTALLPIWKSQEVIKHKLQNTLSGAVVISEFISLCVEFKLKNETLASASRKLPGIENKTKAQIEEIQLLSTQIEAAETQILELHRVLISSHEGSEVDERLSAELSNLSLGSTDLSKAVVIEERTICVSVFHEGTASGGIMSAVSPRHSVLPTHGFPNFENQDLYRDRPPTEEAEFQVEIEGGNEVVRCCGSKFFCL